MLLKYLCLLGVVLSIALSAQAQLGFEEERQPDILKVHGPVKMVEGRRYRPESFGDTLGKGIAESKGIMYYDSLNRLVKLVGNEVKYRKYPDNIEYYTYFGRDSVIKSPRKGDIRSSVAFVTVNKYDKDGRLAQQEFYSNRPRRFSAAVINTYDANGFLVKQVHKGEAGQKAIETKYVNDSRGNHLKILPPSVNANMQTKRTFTYDEHNNVTSIAEYPYPNPPQLFYYVYDDHGNWIKQTEYSTPTCHASQVIFRRITYY